MFFVLSAKPCVRFCIAEEFPFPFDLRALFWMWIVNKMSKACSMILIRTQSWYFCRHTPYKHLCIFRCAYGHSIGIDDVITMLSACVCARLCVCVPSSFMCKGKVYQHTGATACIRIAHELIVNAHFNLISFGRTQSNEAVHNSRLLFFFCLIKRLALNWMPSSPLVISFTFYVPN